MSKFISSFIESINPKPKMKLYSKLHRNQWLLYPIPFISFYFETCQPDAHISIWRNKICGLYLSFNWLKHTYNIGFQKTIN